MLNFAHKGDHYNAIENYKSNIKITFPKEWIKNSLKKITLYSKWFPLLHVLSVL